jgi:hypothetical protein
MAAVFYSRSRTSSLKIPRMSSTHSIIVLAALGIAASIILLITAFFKVRSIGLKVLLALIAVMTLMPAGLVVLVVHPEWVDARYRSYKNFYTEIQPGMTREEVMALQARMYPEGGARQKPRIAMEDDTSLTFFMHPEVSTEPNCEGIFLVFKDGKVTSKTYSPD